MLNDYSQTIGRFHSFIDTGCVIPGKFSTLRSSYKILTDEGFRKMYTAKAIKDEYLKQSINFETLKARSEFYNMLSNISPHAMVIINHIDQQKRIPPSDIYDILTKLHNNSKTHSYSDLVFKEGRLLYRSTVMGPFQGYDTYTSFYGVNERDWAEKELLYAFQKWIDSAIGSQINNS